MNTQIERSAQAIYRQIIDDPSIDRRLKTSLQRIKAVCDVLEREALSHAKNGVRYSRSPLTVSAVGQKCVELYGGPSGKSITRNRQKEPVKALYIESRARELELPRITNPKENDLLSLAPQSVRDYIAHLEAKVQLLEKFVGGLSASLKKIAPVSVDALIDAAFGGSEAKPNTLPVARSQESRAAAQKAMAKLFDNDHLRGFGLRMDRDYLIDAVSGKELLTNLEVAALRDTLR